MISHHRSVPGASRALPVQELERIEKIYPLVNPIDPVVQRAWLFARDAQLLDGARLDNWELREKQLAEKRTQAVAEI